jgi:flagella basal body P-ring formation protein FlgA
VAALAAFLLGAASLFAADASVQIHLPRNITVETATLTLGTVAVVQSADPALEAKASAVAVGRAPWPREELVLDRTTLLARLAAGGITPSQVKLTGADKVAIVRAVLTMRGEELGQAAAAHLDRTCPLQQGGRWQAVRLPKDVTVPSGGPLQIEPHLASGDAASGLARVDVSVSQDGRSCANEQAHFKAVYKERRAVAVMDLPAGVTLTTENVEIREFPSDRPEPAGWKPPYGQVASEATKGGCVVRPSAGKQAPEAEKLISRNDTVTMKIEGDGFTITALGQALDDGRSGAFIRVRNVDSGRIVVGKVKSDGSVEPVISGAKS